MIVSNQVCNGKASFLRSFQTTLIRVCVLTSQNKQRETFCCAWFLCLCLVSVSGVMLGSLIYTENPKIIHKKMDEGEEVGEVKKYNPC